DLLAGEHRDAGAGRLLAGAQLVAAQFHRLGRGTDEDEPVLAGPRCQLRTLGQEAVAGVDRVAAGAERGLHDQVVAQVAVGGGGGAARGEPVAVGVGGADHRLEPELLTRGHDPQRDLAAVGDEHALDPLHAGVTRNSGWPYSTSSALAGTISAIVPDTPAGTE